jgi:hypothetical protein
MLEVHGSDCQNYIWTHYKSTVMRAAKDKAQDEFIIFY